jgi:hypothetical protein
MKTVCSWCNAIIREGTLPISHGCCPTCIVALLADVPPLPIPAVEQLIEEVQRSR